MKVEKINENKIRITLTFEELENREISIKDIEKNSSLAKNLFIDLIEESNLEEDFLVDDSQIFIEASSDNNNLFIMTITKIDDMPNIRDYALMSNKKYKKTGGKIAKTSSSKSATLDYKVDSNIYEFTSLDILLTMCEIAKEEKLFFGRNSLYKYKPNSYFLIFSKSSIKNKSFLKTYVFLSEYCKDYYLSDILESSITEKSKLIIKNNALQKLTKM